MIIDRMITICKRVKPSIDESRISMDARLVEDLAIDSLTMMLLAISVEDEFQIEFDNNSNIHTVRDICEFVASKTGEEIGA